MIIYLVLIIVISLHGIRINKKDESFLSIDQTTSVNGIFVFIVFLSHVQQYIIFESNYMDKLFDFAMGILGQNIVISFLLFSGYGIGECIKIRERGYVRSIPYKRILYTWIHFVIALMLFWGVNAIWTKQTYSAGEYILSLAALKSIGNSTWYVFAILICWLATYVSYRFFKNSSVAIVAVTILLIVYIIIISDVKSQHCWYDTVLCYPLGLVVSKYKESICQLLQNKYGWIAMFTASCSWVLFRVFIEKNIILYEIQSLIFAVCLLTVIYKITLNNRFLYFLGKHTFSIYILQRIPMIILSYYEMNTWNSLAFTGICMIITCVMAVGYDLLMKQIDKKLSLIGENR